MELLVRDARLSDIDRVTGLMERADSRLSFDRLNDAADVLRQIIYLPNASMLICLDGRLVLGASMLAIRPSVAAAGLVGTVDMLVIEPGHELSGVVDALLKELTRQARNKGCVALEGNIPEDPAELASWEKVGFSEAETRMRLPLVRAAVAAW